jgi:hypothetical protein
VVLNHRNTNINHSMQSLNIPRHAELIIQGNAEVIIQTNAEIVNQENIEILIHKEVQGLEINHKRKTQR